MIRARKGVCVGLIVTLGHVVISVPFLFLGPMLTTPEHGGVLGWIWFSLELPAILPIVPLQRVLVLSNGSPDGEFLSFVLLATVWWFVLGFAVSMLWQVVRTLAVQESPGANEMLSR